jgi:hypothetical protein
MGRAGTRAGFALRSPPRFAGLRPTEQSLVNPTHRLRSEDTFISSMLKGSGREGKRPMAYVGEEVLAVCLAAGLARRGGGRDDSGSKETRFAEVFVELGTELV